MSTLHNANLELPASPTSAQRRRRMARSNSNVTTNPSPFLVSSGAGELIGNEALSIALIGPDDHRRAAAVEVLAGFAVEEICAFTSYQPGTDDVSIVLEQKYDVVIIELDTNPEHALELVESVGAKSAATVMVYSENADPELLLRVMRAGAREFLKLPFEPAVVAEALMRAAARRPVTRTKKTAEGKLSAFMSAKGGAGATILACNFAVALAQARERKTLLIDLDLPLGDAALNLGIAAEFSAIDALQAAERLDANFLSQLVVKHSSGVWVLAAPGKFAQYQASDEAIDRLIDVARQEFDNVVVDMGSKLDLMGTSVYKEAATIYLVTQSSIPELRNSNRLVSQFFTAALPKLEIVINRFEPHALGFSEEHITKALTRPAQWKIPNDYASVRKMQLDGTPLVLADSAIARRIRKMAQAFSGQEEEKAKAPSKKKPFFFF
jgi:pilus assembly protein CpaE